MKNCAEKKQTTVKVSINFPKFSIEFELRGATKGEFEKLEKSYNDIFTNPKFMTLTAKAEYATLKNNFDDFTVDEVRELMELKQSNKEQEKEKDFKLLVTCLTKNLAFDAGFKILNNDEVAEKIKTLDDALSIIQLTDVNNLIDIAYNLSTLGRGSLEDKEVAEEEVK